MVQEFSVITTKLPFLSECHERIMMLLNESTGAKLTSW